MKNGASILSELDPIQVWIDTPKGYYAHAPTFGNNLHELLFKTRTNVKLGLDDIVDSIARDLGYEIASRIRVIRLLSTEDRDSLYIGIEQYHKDIILKRVES